MHARYYGPLTGRFLSVDPVEGRPKAPQSWNRYTYAVSNPLKYVDPDGKEALVFTVASSGADDPKGLVGHAAIYVTSPSGNAGVSAYGEHGFERGVGGFVGGYTSAGRAVRMYVLNTTPEQDAKMVKFISGNPSGGIDKSKSIVTENCTTACVNVLQAGGVVGEGSNPGAGIGTFFIDNPKELQRALDSGELEDLVGVVIIFDPEEEEKNRDVKGTAGEEILQ